MKHTLTRKFVWAGSILLLCGLIAVTIGFIDTKTQKSAHADGSSSTITQGLGPIMGGGNFTNGDPATQQLDALNVAGVGMGRYNLYPDYYYNDGTSSVVLSLDTAILAAYHQHIMPMILFEYYGNYSNPLGDHSKWYAIGQAYAQRYGPGSSWLQSQGVTDPNFGLHVYQAMNEPDIGNSIPKQAYHDALQGLADGVHAVNSNLKVIPGGFATPNSASDFTCNGYASAIADLLNNGTLDGIDLHTYYDVQYAPMENTYAFSAQYDFDHIKATIGVTRDINFYTTEFNYKERLVDDQQAARGFLTGIWDNVGVVKNDGTGATQFALPWNIFNTITDDPDDGMCTQLSPWTPTPRGSVLPLVTGLTAGMTMISQDPKNTGEYVLSNATKKLWVWQDRQAWTNHPGTSYTVNGIPAGATTLQVYGWNGLRQTINLSGQSSYTVSGLPGDETYMFLVTYTSSSTPTPVPTTTPTPNPGTLVAAINAGGSAAGNYMADTDYNTGNQYSDTSSPINTNGVSNPAPQAIYQTCRWNSSFTYTIPNLIGGASYTVRLDWAELTWTQAGQRLFNVAINGSTVLNNFDVYATAGYKTALVKTFAATANSNRQIVISFTQGSADNPFINGIAILQQTAPTPTPTATPSPTPTPGTLVTAINAGGATAGNYVADTDYNTGNQYSDSSSSINTNGVSNPAPQAVYQSCRWNSSFTYTIPNLTAGASYTVRLDWAELTWTQAGQRLFNVAINGSTVLSNFDVYATAGYKTALVKTFTTKANSNGQIVINFKKGSADNPFINGITILTA